jgi:hypothetical protein
VNRASSLIARPRQIDRAYLLFSYDPRYGGYPLVELQFEDVKPS